MLQAHITNGVVNSSKTNQKKIRKKKNNNNYRFTFQNQ